MSRKGKFIYSATADSARVAEYLTKIAGGLVAGSLSIAADEQSLNLSPADIVKLEIEADSNPDKGRGRIIVDVSWKAATESPSAKLEISTRPHVEEAETTTEPSLTCAVEEKEDN